MKTLVQKRPAETGGAVAGAVAFLIGRLTGVEDTPTLFALSVVVGFVPTAITFLVTLLRGDEEA